MRLRAYWPAELGLALLSFFPLISRENEARGEKKESACPSGGEESESVRAFRNVTLSLSLSFQYIISFVSFGIDPRKAHAKKSSPSGCVFVSSPKA